MKEYRNIITREALFQRLNEDYKVDLGKYISEGFNIFQKEAGLFVGYAVVAVLLLFVSAFTIVGAVLVSFPLLAGYSIAAHQIKNGQPVSFETFFKGFSHFSDLLTLTMLTLGIFMLAMLPILVGGLMIGFNFESGSSFSLGIFSIFYLISIVGFIVISVLYFFSMNIVLFSELRGWEAMEASRKMVAKNFWWILLMSILVGLISQVGSIACYIGMLVTYPIGYCISYAAFADIFKLNESYSSEDDIERHFV